MKNITFDESIYRPTLKHPDSAMKAAGARINNQGHDFAHHTWETMLAHTPDTLPGVVEHSGEPAAHGLLLNGKLAERWITTAGRNGAEGMRDNYVSLCRPVDLPQIEIAALFTHPPAQPDTAELQARIAELEDQLETERVRLAGCGVAALSNTVGTVAQRIARDNPYWSASYGDVCSAVDREMDLREKLIARNAQLAAQAGQEPIAWRAHRVGKGKNPQMSYEGPVLCQSLKIADQWRQERIDFDGYAEAWIEPLYAAPPAPANSIVIVQAALEVALNICSIAAENDEGPSDCIRAIRAINPQSILDAMSKKGGAA